MEEARVNITTEESNEVYNLFNTYISYMHILQYFMNAGQVKDQALYDKKWDEAVTYNIKLDAAKRAIEKKYKPEGDWDRYEFDFDNHQVVFIKDDT